LGGARGREGNQPSGPEFEAARQRERKNRDKKTWLLETWEREKKKKNYAKGGEVNKQKHIHLKGEIAPILLEVYLLLTTCWKGGGGGWYEVENIGRKGGK